MIKPTKKELRENAVKAVLAIIEEHTEITIEQIGLPSQDPKQRAANYFAVASIYGHLGTLTVTSKILDLERSQVDYYKLCYDNIVLGRSTKREEERELLVAMSNDLKACKPYKEACKLLKGDIF